jgi:LuxR family maltose regulon positive regulatory protein
VQAWVLEAEIALARRQMPLARQRVLAALDTAADQGLLRPLLHAGPALHQYLAARRGMFGEHEGHVGRVLSWTRVPADAAAVALTDREQEVLALLPTTRSAAEIAEDLAVSTNTVKTHQRAIYHKLGAGGRRDAVTLARRAGLLTHSA